jgi:hypothetical protein
MSDLEYYPDAVELLNKHRADVVVLIVLGGQHGSHSATVTTVEASEQWNRLGPSLIRAFAERIERGETELELVISLAEETKN